MFKFFADTNTQADVQMNSWCKFGEYSTHRYRYIDLTISS